MGWTLHEGNGLVGSWNTTFGVRKALWILWRFIMINYLSMNAIVSFWDCVNFERFVPMFLESVSWMMDNLKWLPISSFHENTLTNHQFFCFGGVPAASTIAVWLPSAGWWGWSPWKSKQFQVFFQGWPEHRDHNALISMKFCLCFFLGGMPLKIMF